MNKKEGFEPQKTWKIRTIEPQVGIYWFLFLKSVYSVFFALSITLNATLIQFKKAMTNACGIYNTALNYTP